jgi:dolichyl-phosphate-mannose-protein mannosyltransferase
VTIRTDPSAVTAADLTSQARRGVEQVRSRLAAPMPRGLWAWLGPLLVTALGGCLRFWRLGEPRAVVFDETYYAKDAYSLLRHGYERNWVDGADGRILDGTDPASLLTTEPSFVVHPPVGKWVIAAGEWAQGMDPFGWRFGVAVLGTLGIFLTARIAMRLTRSVLLGCVAGLLLTLDGLHFVMSRTALLDGILAFFVLAAFGCLLVDRDRSRARLAELSGAPSRRHRRHRAAAADPAPAGPGLGLRPWRLAAGMFLGLAIATKWSALPFVAVFGLMAVLWDAGARRGIGIRRPYSAALVRDAAPAFAALVILPALVYLASWSGWFLSDGGWDRDWADGRSTSWPFIPEALRSLWHYHAGMWRFHVGLTESHPYASSPWGWLVIARPVSYFFEQSDSGCAAAPCVREVVAIGTPALWWAAVAAIAFLLWRWAGPRDWRAGAVLAAVAAGWLPWFRYQDRPVFYFYAVVFVPFLVFGITMLLGAVLGGPEASRRRRTWGAAVAGGLVAVVAVQFFAFYPVLSAESIPRTEWSKLMWFRSWI